MITLEKAIRDIGNMVAIQSQPGNVDVNDYMRGMANGLICAQSCVTGEEPKFFETPIVSNVGISSQEYMKAAARTESIPASLEINEFGMQQVLQLIADTGNAVNLVKRHLYYGAKGRMDVHLFRAALEQVKHDADNLIALGASVLDRYQGPASAELDNLDIRLTHATLGIFTESGEMAEHLIAGGETGVDFVGFAEEIGDVDWYKAIIHNVTNINEPALREINIAKLRKRYPEKFNEVSATERDLVGERSTLESSFDKANEIKPAPVDSAGGHTD